MTTSMMSKTDFTLKTNPMGERYFYNTTRGLFDKVGSKVLYDKYLKPYLFQKDTLYIIVGTDSGLLPNYINQHEIPTGTRYLLIEPQKNLSAIFSHHLLDPLHPSISIASELDYQATAEYLKLNEYLFIQAVKHMPSLTLQQSTLDEYESIKWHVQEWLDDLYWKNQASIAGNQHFITKQIENCVDNQIPVSILKNEFKGQTVVILAGGPSLHEAIPWVKANRQSLVVFAVARISKQLLAHHLTPDFLFAVDPFDISFNMCCEAFQFDPAPILIHANHVAPKLLSQWHGQSLYLSNRLPFASDLNLENIFGAGPSVTNAALSVAEFFGFQQILLSGVDLCFTKQGITHALGSREAEAGPKYNTTSLQVKTYEGVFHPTSVDFHSALNNLSIQAKAIKDGGARLINLSKSAAIAEGIDYVPFNEIELAQKLDDTLSEMIQKIHQSKSMKTAFKSLQKLETELDKARVQITQIESLIKNAIEQNEQLFDDEDFKINWTQKNALDEIENKLNTEFKTFSTLIKTFSMKGMLKINKPHDNNRQMNSVELQALGRMYYKAYLHGTISLKQLIKAACQRTKARIEEHHNPPDCKLLIEQWRADKSYRRCLFLKQKLVIIPDAFKRDFEALEQSFQQQCEQADIDNTTRVSSMLGNIEAVPVKAKQLLMQSKQSELQDLYESLLKDSRNNHHTDHLALIKGFMLEINEEYIDALHAYHAIVEYPNSPLLEDALNRIVNISIHLKDYDNAKLALQCLTDISPIYLPAYAESEKLSGNLLEAIDAYHLYIEQFLDDVETQLKLCHLYIENDVPQAAIMLLQDVLKKNPENTAAQNILEAICV